MNCTAFWLFILVVSIKQSWRCRREKCHCFIYEGQTFCCLSCKSFVWISRNCLSYRTFSYFQAIQEFTELCKTKEDDVISSILSFWPRIYHKLAHVSVLMFKKKFLTIAFLLLLILLLTFSSNIRLVNANFFFNDKGFDSWDLQLFLEKMFW